ncbi:MAG: PHP domain-containing protein [Actinomycetes bacterium]
MPAADLHTHSTASDGTTSPADLVRSAAAAGLDVVALTDHDTTAGHDEALRALPRGLGLVRGAEISCAAGGVSLHLLGYLFDPTEPELAAALETLRASRTGRAERMARRLEADGTGVTWERVQQLAQGTVGRPHLARAIVEQGLVASMDEAFSADWIGTGGRYWEPKVELDVVRGVELVVRAGGVAVFAHPAADARGETVADDVVVAMAEAGLAGLEVDHVDHDEAARRRLRGLAAELGLLVTGSSDYHGENKAVRLGEHTTPPEVVEALADRATGAGLVRG